MLVVLVDMEEEVLAMEVVLEVEVVAVVSQLGDMVVGEVIVVEGDLVVVLQDKDMVQYFHHTLVSVAVLVEVLTTIMVAVMVEDLFLVGMVVEVVVDLVVLSILAMVMVTVTEEEQRKS